MEFYIILLVFFINGILYYIISFFLLMEFYIILSVFFFKSYNIKL